MLFICTHLDHLINETKDITVDKLFNITIKWECLTVITTLLTTTKNVEIVQTVSVFQSNTYSLNLQ